VHAVDEVAAPAVGLDLGLVLLVVLDELLLLVAFGLEEETADLVEGKAQTVEQFPGAAGREGLAEGVADEGLGLGRRLEAAGGGLLLELLLLGETQVSGVAAIREMIESVEPFFSISKQAARIDSYSDSLTQTTVLVAFFGSGFPHDLAAVKGFTLTVWLQRLPVG